MSHLTAVPDDDDEADDKQERFDAIAELPEAVQRLQELKAEKADVEEEILFCENWIDNHVKESEIVQIGEKQYKTTPVRGRTTSVDTRKMHRLAPDLARRVITIEEVEKVDTDLLAKEIEKGNVPIELLKQFISQKPKKTSIRLTEYTPREDQEESTDE